MTSTPIEFGIGGETRFIQARPEVRVDISLIATETEFLDSIPNIKDMDSMSIAQILKEVNKKIKKRK